MIARWKCVERKTVYDLLLLTSESFLTQIKCRWLLARLLHCICSGAVQDFSTRKQHTHTRTHARMHFSIQYLAIMAHDLYKNEQWIFPSCFLSCAWWTHTNVVHFVLLPSFTRTIPSAATFRAFFLGCEMMKERIIINCNENVEYKQKQQHKFFLFRIYYYFLFCLCCRCCCCLLYSNLPASLLHTHPFGLGTIFINMSHTHSHQRCVHRRANTRKLSHAKQSLTFQFNFRIYLLEVENAQLTDSIFKCLLFFFLTFSKLWLYDQLTRRPLGQITFRFRIVRTSLMTTVKMALMRFGSQ